MRPRAHARALPLSILPVCRVRCDGNAVEMHGTWLESLLRATLTRRASRPWSVAPCTCDETCVLVRTGLLDVSPFRPTVGHPLIAHRDAGDSCGAAMYAPTHLRRHDSARPGLSLATWMGPLGRTEPRWVVGFEGVLGALRAALDGGVLTSIHGGVEQRHGFFGEVAAIAGDPFVVHVDEDRADESDDGCGVGEDADDAASALDLLVDPLDSGLVDQILRQWALGKAVKARTSAFASSISGPTFGKEAASWSRTSSQALLTAGGSGWAKIVRNTAATMSAWSWGRARGGCGRSGRGTAGARTLGRTAARPPRVRSADRR